MKDLQCHRGSRKGYRSHLTKLITSAYDLLTTDPESSGEEKAKTATALDSLLGQLSRKATLLADLDAKILSLVDREDELEAEVFEAEEIQSKLAETVSNIRAFTTRLLHEGDKVQQPEHAKYPKSKLPKPVSVTVPESPPTENLEATRNTEHNRNDSTSELLPPHDNVPTNRGQVAACLPKLTIPMFGGDPLDWEPFWDSFEAAIHSNTQLNGA